MGIWHSLHNLLAFKRWPPLSHRSEITLPNVNRKKKNMFDNKQYFACLHMSMLHARPHTISLTKRRRQILTHSSHFELLVINSRHNFPFLSKHSQFIISPTSHYIGTFLSESGPCWWDCKRWFPRFYRNDATVLLFYSKMPEHGDVLAVKGCARSGWILQEWFSVLQ